MSHTKDHAGRGRIARTATPMASRRTLEVPMHRRFPINSNSRSKQKAAQPPEVRTPLLLERVAAARDALGHTWSTADVAAAAERGADYLAPRAAPPSTPRTPEPAADRHTEHENTPIPQDGKPTKRKDHHVPR
jgi:hypothetical protein